VHTVSVGGRLLEASQTHMHAEEIFVYFEEDEKMYDDDEKK